MIDLYYWPTPNGHKITMFLEEAGPRLRDPSGRYQRRRISSSAISSPSRRTTACRRLSIPRRRTWASRSACSSPGAILLYALAERRPAASCRRTCAAGKPRWSGCSGKWAAWGRWPDRTTISASTRQARFLTPIERYVKGDEPAVWRARPPSRIPHVHRRRRLQRRRHGCLSVDRSLEAPAAESGRVSNLRRWFDLVRGSPRNAACLREGRAVLGPPPLSPLRGRQEASSSGQTADRGAGSLTAAARKMSQLPTA